MDEEKSLEKMENAETIFSPGLRGFSTTKSRAEKITFALFGRTVFVG
jgi:hypothetical protein